MFGLMSCLEWRSRIVLLLAVFPWISIFGQSTLSVEESLEQGIQAIYPLEQAFPERAIHRYDSLYKECINAAYYPGAIHCLLYAGIVHNDQGHYLKALAYYREAELLAKEKGLVELLLKINNNMGVTFNLRGNKDSAAVRLLRGMGIAETLNDTAYMLRLGANLSGILSELDQQQQDVELTDRMLKVAMAYGDSAMYVSAIINYANSRRRIGPFDEAEQLYRKAVDIAAALQDDYLIYLAHTGIADYYYHADKQILSLSHSEKALKAARANQVKYFEVHALQNLGLMYMEVNEVQRALEYIDQSIDIATSIEAIDLLSTSLLYRSEVLAKDGRHAEAYASLQERHAVEESLRTAGQAKVVADLESMFQSERKDRLLTQKELLLQQAEVKSREQWVYVVILVVGLLVTIAFAFFSIRLWRQKSEIQEAKIEQGRQEALLKSIASKLTGEEEERQRMARELHDGIGGRLSLMKSRLASGVAPEVIFKELSATNEEVRRIAHNLMPEVLLKYGLKQALAAHFENMAGEGIELEMSMNGDDSALPQATSLHVYRIVQELVTNAYKHACAKHIFVSIAIDEGNILVAVEDDGCGMPQGKVSDGAGLIAIRQRMQLIGGEINIDSSADRGTAFNLSIPLFQPVEV